MKKRGVRSQESGVRSLVAICAVLCVLCVSVVNVHGLDQKADQHTIMPIGPPWEDPVFFSQCSNWWYWTQGRTYTAVINGTEYTIAFGDSATGPCPAGKAHITWEGGESTVPYASTPEMLIIGGEPFVVIHYRLIWIPQGLVVLDPDFPVAMPTGE